MKTYCAYLCIYEKEAILNETYLSNLTLWGAFDGVLIARDNGANIALFFDALPAETYHPFLFVHSSLCIWTPGF